MCLKPVLIIIFDNPLMTRRVAVSAPCLVQLEEAQMKATQTERSFPSLSRVEVERPLAPTEKHIDKNAPIAIPRQASLVAGVAVAITAGTISQVVNQPPEYEGSFELTVQPEAASPEAIPTPRIEAVNQPISDTQLRILESPRILNPVIERLKTEDASLNYQEFIDRLDLKRQGNQQLLVSYRDTDPERVQLVLEQLAQIYVAHGQECQDSVCQGLNFVEAQIPQVQQRVNELRDQIQQFHDQYGLKNLEAQVRLFTARSTEIAKQSAELQGKLAEARQQDEELQMRMALKPEEKVAETLLQQDVQYQAALRQFQQLDRQLTVALSSYRAADSQLQTLQTQHQQKLTQLHQATAQILPRHLSDPTANLKDPIFQDPQLLELLQQSVHTTHYIQILEVRQQTIAQVQQSLNQQKQDLATILRKYADLRQQLQAETEILQQYFDKRDLLKAQVEQLDTLTWNISQAPDLLRNASGQPAPDYLHNLKEDMSSAAILGILLGLAVAIVREEKRQNRLNPLFTKQEQSGYDRRRVKQIVERRSLSKFGT